MNLDVKLLAVRGEAVIGECEVCAGNVATNQKAKQYKPHTNIRDSVCVSCRESVAIAKFLNRKKYCVLFTTKNLAAITRRKIDSKSHSHNHKDKVTKYFNYPKKWQKLKGFSHVKYTLLW